MRCFFSFRIFRDLNECCRQGDPGQTDQGLYVQLLSWFLLSLGEDPEGQRRTILLGKQGEKDLLLNACSISDFNFLTFFRASWLTVISLCSTTWRPSRTKARCQRLALEGTASHSWPRPWAAVSCWSSISSELEPTKKYRATSKPGQATHSKKCFIVSEMS